MENYRLPYLEVVDKEREVRYLGYKLPLTTGEYEVFKAVFYHKGYADVETIMEKVPCDLKLSPNSIAVHVAAINKKSVALGGKKLVASKRLYGYFVNEDM